MLRSPRTGSIRFATFKKNVLPIQSLPWPLLGISRIRSTVLAVVYSSANSVTFCPGSLGARPDNDLQTMWHASHCNQCR
ncbi:hypothetical protein FVA77_09455 [Phyllobacterium endophyticum]|nr:hypothetical protein FVA77_09455 [Phyllobacterium endophyticum]